MKRLLACLMICALLGTAPALAEAENPAVDFLTRFWTGEENEALYAMFSGDLKAAVPFGDFCALKGQLTALGGELLGILDESAVAGADGGIRCSVTMDMAAQDLLLTFVMDAEGTVLGISFSIPPAETVSPETVALPQGVVETDVTVGEEPYLLSGKLTMPEAGTALPAVVLVHGSGPQDMDETVGATKLFRDLAYGLAQRGIAVLRYEKRTKAYGAQIAAAEDFASFTVEGETIEDALWAVQLLQAEERIDPSRVFVLGHSLGAMLAPRIAKEASGRVAGVILLNGTPREFWELMLRQNRDAVAALPAEQQAAYTAQLDAIEAACASLSTITQEEAVNASLFGVSAWYLAEMVQQGDAAKLLTELAMPALIVNGARDFQVTEAEGRLAWEETLDMSSPWLKTFWPDTNHLMMAPEVSSDIAGTTSEYDVPCTADEESLAVIGDFILKTEE